jgi:hypothetical protein
VKGADAKIGVGGHAELPPREAKPTAAAAAVLHPTCHRANRADANSENSTLSRRQAGFCALIVHQLRRYPAAMLPLRNTPQSCRGTRSPAGERHKSELTPKKMRRSSWTFSHVAMRAVRSAKLAAGPGPDRVTRIKVDQTAAKNVQQWDGPGDHFPNIGNN